MSSPISLRSFLNKARDVLQKGIKARSKLTFVIGNESADLDSMTCSLIYSYIRSSSAANGQHGTMYIPITNIPASDMKLRPEFASLLPHAGLEPATLITLDDLPMDGLEEKLPPALTSWILVDHNSFQGVLGKTYGRRVVGVIDHHEEENQVPADTGSEPRIIEKSGSCTSLVVEHLQKDWEALGGNSSEAEKSQSGVREYSSQAGRLALASILVDTANLQDESKTTDHDRAAVKFLNTLINAADNQSFYKQLQAAKQDIGSLALVDILRKDYKEWDCKDMKLGIAAVVKPLSYLASKAVAEKRSPTEAASGKLLPADCLMNVTRKFAESRNLDVVAVMTTSTASTGEFQRELLVAASSRAAVRALERFEAIARSELKLEPTKNGQLTFNSKEGQFNQIWQQRAVQHSRKRVAPLLRQAIDESTAESQL